MQSRRNDLNVFKSGCFELFGYPVCRALDVGLVLAFGADARDAEEFAEFFEVRVAATFDKFSKVHRGRYESRSFRLGIRLGKSECCSPGSASDDCKETYKGAVDILGCLGRLTQVSLCGFGACFVRSAAGEGRDGGVPKRWAARLYF